jgi:hypothetical protein
MGRAWIFLLLGIGAVGAAAVVAACSTSIPSEPAPKSDCDPEPSLCPAGQTCWPVDDALDFQCLPTTAEAGVGDPCQNTIGVPTCGPGLFCFAPPQGASACIPYCDTKVPNNTAAQLVSGGARGPVVSICFPDAGSDGRARDAAGD